jgi:hypothetical protein
LKDRLNNIITASEPPKLATKADNPNTNLLRVFPDQEGVRPRTPENFGNKTTNLNRSILFP